MTALTALHLLAQQGQTHEPRWFAALIIIGVLAATVALGELIVWLIHHWPHAKRDERETTERTRPRYGDPDAGDRPDGDSESPS